MFYILNEHPVNWQFGFQPAASPVMEGITNFHHDLFFFLVVITCVVLYMLSRAILTFNSKTNKQSLVVTHGATLEIIWTLIPATILIFIAIPSFSLLYSIEEIVEPLLTVKVIGHQWYWTYEFLHPDYIYWDIYNDYMNFVKDHWNQKDTPEWLNQIVNLENDAFVKQYANKAQKTTADSFTYDSYMLSDDQVKYKYQRLLQVDNKLYLPVQANVRLLITSADVLHSWAVPALGVKLDACPGRLNQTSVYIRRQGNFYGQCSEICGINHAFMPINVAAIDIIGGFAPWFNRNSDAIAVLFTYFIKNKING